jgi:hypothetical protein
MVDEFNPLNLVEPSFKKVEDLVIQAENKFLEYLEHPIFSKIGTENQKRIRDTIRTIQVLEFDEFLSTFTNYDNLDEEIKIEAKEKLKEEMRHQVNAYLPAKNKSEQSRIILNYNAFKNNPFETQFIFENIAKLIAQDLSYKGELIDLVEYTDPKGKHRKQLPPTAQNSVDDFIKELNQQNINLQNYKLRQVGFATASIRQDGSYNALDEELEDLRSDILRTVIEALMYGAVNTKANSLERLVSGINNLEKYISKLDPLFFTLYHREHYSIEFLIRYITEAPRATNIKLDSKQAKKAFADLEQLVGLLVNSSANDFILHLSKSKNRLEGFRHMHLQYSTRVWPLDEFGLES